MSPWPTGDNAAMFQDGDRVGPYTLRHQLGFGAFGVVWLGERNGPFAVKNVAIKFPLCSIPNLDEVRQEAQVWVKASGHPNILSVIEVEVYDRQIVFVSEYAEGGSLKDWIESNNGCTTPADAINKVQAVLAGLVHLHSKGIVHRDLKPANVLLQSGVPKIADFGMSRMLNTTSHSQSIGGTPAYMAPEAFSGKRSPMTDIWSAGVILYELVASRQPFNGNNLAEMLRAVCHDEPNPLPDSTPRSLASILGRALHKSAEARYQSAEEMLSDLQSASLSQNGRPAIPNTLAEKSPASELVELPPKVERGVVSTVTAFGFGAAAVGSVVGFGAGSQWFKAAADQWPVFSGDELLASVELASTGIVTGASYIVCFGLWYTGWRTVRARQKARSLLSRLFNIAAATRELCTLYGWLVGGLLAGAIAFVVLKILIIAFALPASFVMAGPLTPKSGLFSIGISYGVAGLLLGVVIHQYLESIAAFLRNLWEQYFE